MQDLLKSPLHTISATTHMGMEEGEDNIDNIATDSIKVCDTESFAHSLVARKWLLDDVFINRICNETFGTPSEGITLITLLNRYSTTLRRDFNDVLTMQSTQFLMKYSTTLRRDLSLLRVVE